MAGNISLVKPTEHFPTDLPDGSLGGPNERSVGHGDGKKGIVFKGDTEEHGTFYDL